MAADEPEFVDKEKDEALEPEPLPETVQPVMNGSPSRASLPALLLYLLLGGATEGTDQFSRRLKQWQAEIESRGDEIYSKSPDETEEERFRYALIGILSSGTRVSLAALSVAVNASASAYAFFSTLLRPITGSKLVEPVHRRYDKWIEAGRRIEQQSRTLARQAALDEYDEGIDLVLGKMAEDPAVAELVEKQSDVLIKIIVDKLAQDPAVRDLIKQQSAGMADEVKDSLRKRSAVADARWEDRVHGLLGRH